MKRNFCKILALLCSLALLITVFSGCGSKETTAEGTTTSTATSEASATDTQPKEPQKISLWAFNANDNNDAIVKSMVKSFEKLENVTVDIVQAPRGETFETKLNAAIAGGNPPDVSYLDQPLVAKFAKDDVLLDLTPYMNGADGIVKTEFYAGALETNLVGDKYYGLPLSHTCVALLYNKDLVPTPPTTWSEMLEVAKKVYVKGKISAFERPWDGGGGGWMFPAFIGTAGGAVVAPDNSKVTFDTPEGAEALSFFYKDLMQYSDMAVYKSANAFGKGLVAMRIAGPWDVPGYLKDFPNLKFGVANIPKKDGKEFASNMGGENIVVYKATKSPEAAWKLIKWLTNEENNLPMAKLITGNFPVRLKAIEDPYYTTDEYMKAFLEQAKYAVARPRLASWSKINDQCLGKEIDEFTAGKKTAEQALKDAADRANAIIAEDNK